MNKDFTLVTDSGCDLPMSYLETEGIKCIQLSFYFENDGDVNTVTNNNINSTEFYARMRDGEVAKTSAPSPDAFETTFREILDKGRDILYLGFDSSLSTTFNSARLAFIELQTEYPDRTILLLDSLCASAGQGLLVALTNQVIKDGYTLREAYDYAADLAPRISHRFTVETLTYLCRGGRVSKSAMMAGNLLNIKPVLHMDDEGHLINLFKARGRAKSLSMLLDAYEETRALNGSSLMAAGAENMIVEDTVDRIGHYEDMIMISHADCREDADRLANMIKTRFNREVSMICDIGPVIGSHAGPGTIALFFVGTKR